MTDKYIDVILNAIKDLQDEKNLRVETDDLSTMLKGKSEKIFQALEIVFLHAAKNADHVAMDITFSRGCPGEPDEPCCNDVNCDKPLKHHPASRLIPLKKTGIIASAQFALYPLNNPDYMDVIYQEIERAKHSVKVTPKHFCTRLDGDTNDIFYTIQQAFENTGRTTRHVVVTAIISKKNYVK